MVDFMLFLFYQVKKREKEGEREREAYSILKYAKLQPKLKAAEDLLGPCPQAWMLNLYL